MATVCALWWAIQQRALEFDPENQLQSPQWLTLAREVNNTPHSGPSLVIISDASCQCAKVSEAHQTKVVKDALQAGIEVTQLQLTDGHREWLPAVPAAILFNNQNDVIYAGPLSVGLACAAKDGIIDTVIANYTRGYHSELLVSNAMGCYCRT
ncbi:DUF6436 domain-containing protein [Pseudoalteromonas sp. SSDWG2]|uniref:DUF6436 domain-containing protein n=1 Tax=Pseudoalteromonas sp. SSDWG2 TaxID=3139391 RepID=UPI003BA907A2